MNETSDAGLSLSFLTFTSLSTYCKRCIGQRVEDNTGRASILTIVDMAPELLWVRASPNLWLNPPLGDASTKKLSFSRPVKSEDTAEAAEYPKCVTPERPVVRPVDTAGYHLHQPFAVPLPHGLNNLTDEAIAAKCPALAALEVYQCNNITDEAIKPIAANCPVLTESSRMFLPSHGRIDQGCRRENCPSLSTLDVVTLSLAVEASQTNRSRPSPHRRELPFIHRGLRRQRKPHGRSNHGASRDASVRHCSIISYKLITEFVRLQR